MRTHLRSMVNLPYPMGKACYRLALRPPVGPVHIPELTLESPGKISLKVMHFSGSNGKQAAIV